MIKKNLSSKYNLGGTSETQKNGYQLGDEKNVKTLKIEAKYASRKSYGIPLEKWLQQYAFSFVERNYYIRRAIGSSKNCLRAAKENALNPLVDEVPKWKLLIYYNLNGT